MEERGAGGRERRDLDARSARDRLAALLDLHPRELGALSKERAQAMANTLEEEEEDVSGHAPLGESRAAGLGGRPREGEACANCPGGPEGSRAGVA